MEDERRLTVGPNVRQIVYDIVNAAFQPLYSMITLVQTHHWVISC